MTTNCHVVFWTGSWNRKRVLVEKLVEVKVWRLVNSDVPMLVS